MLWAVVRVILALLSVQHSVCVILYKIGVLKGSTIVIAPLSRQCHCRGAQVHSVHLAASHIPTLYFPSRSRYSFTDPERMEGWVRVQRATGSWLLRDRPQPAGLKPTTSWSLVEPLTTRLSCHPVGETNMYVYYVCCAVVFVQFSVTACMWLM